MRPLALVPLSLIELIPRSPFNCFFLRAIPPPCPSFTYRSFPRELLAPSFFSFWYRSTLWDAAAFWKFYLAYACLTIRFVTQALGSSLAVLYPFSLFSRRTTLFLGEDTHLALVLLFLRSSSKTIALFLFLSFFSPRFAFSFVFCFPSKERKKAIVFTTLFRAAGLASIDRSSSSRCRFPSDAAITSHSSIGGSGSICFPACYSTESFNRGIRMETNFWCRREKEPSRGA